MQKKKLKITFLRWIMKQLRNKYSKSVQANDFK